MLYQNVRGLNTKLSSRFVDSFNFNFHFIVITETWLKDSELLCSKYQTFRCDRTDISKETGGGVLIAVANELPCEQINVSSYPHIEFLAIKVRFRNKSIFISCSYIPPNPDVSLYACKASAIKYAFNSSKVQDTLVVLGDFNLPFISWNMSSESNFLVPYIANGGVNNFLEALFSYGVFQVNGVKNIACKFLDLIFVNHPSEIPTF